MQTCVVPTSAPLHPPLPPPVRPLHSPPSVTSAKTAAHVSNSFTLTDIRGCNASQKMSRRASKGVKKARQQQGREEDAQPAPLHLTAHPTKPLPMLSVAQSILDMYVSAQLCDAQGAARIRFVRLPPRVRRPFAGVPVCDMSLTHGERLRVVACALTGKLVRLLSLGTGCYFESDGSACHKLMQRIVRRVAAKLMHSVVGNKVYKEAEQLCASGQCATAAVALKLAVDLGHLPSRALKAWLLFDGREGVAEDWNGAFELAEEGARLGCHHCQGVMAWCYMWGDGCVKDKARSLELARESAGKGSKYGQHTLGKLYQMGWGGVAQDYGQALALYRLAAAQNLDGAQVRLGEMYDRGDGVAQDLAESLRLYQLAAAQGHREALYMVAAHKTLVWFRGRGC